MTNEFIEEYKQLNCTPGSPEVCSKPNADYLVKNIELPLFYGERVAIWSIAHALKEQLGCDETFCPGDTHFPPFEVIYRIWCVTQCSLW